jgi:uncharacterized repeat protein (TIGR01451 family)
MSFTNPPQSLPPEVGFAVAGYDATKPLIIDPVLVYSTYLGGSQDEQVSGLAVDAAGNVYVAGSTNSRDFPVANAFQPTVDNNFSSFNDLFITKLDATGTALLYSTYLGGSGDDTCGGLAADRSGNVYVTGYTFSTNFPLANALQSYGGRTDAFVTKLTPAGGLAYSTYLGGSDDDGGSGIAADALGNAYVAGFTDSTNFPTRNPLQPFLNGGRNAFIVKIDTTATGAASLVYSTFLGGSTADEGRAIAMDAAGNIYVTGKTSSDNFPTTAGVAQPARAGGDDVFISKVNANGALLYSTYLGGGSDDAGNGITTDSAGNVYVTGETDSDDFPTTPGAFQTTCDCFDDDVFVTKLNAAGNALVYSTFLGGEGDDDGNAIAVDAAGNTYVVGDVQQGFPTTPGAFDTIYGGGKDVSVTKLNVDGTALLYSTYLGGGGSDGGFKIIVDTTGNAYVTGFAGAGFPITPGAVQAVFGGGNRDAFVTKLTPDGTALVYSTYLGGSSSDTGSGLAVDSADNAYVTGDTASSNFPVVNAVQPTFGGIKDAFVTKLSAAGDALVYSTYLGGSGDDFGLAISVDASGNTYVTGNAKTGFPTTTGAFQATNSGNSDAFITKLSSGGGVTPMADLMITKSDSPDPATVGSTLTYTLTATNNGPNDATGVMLTDTLPTGVSFVSVTPSQGTCTKLDAVTCSLGTLASGANATVSLVVTPTTAGSITNTASVSGNETDPNTANNTATQSTAIIPGGGGGNGPDLTGAWLSLTQTCKTVRGVQKCTVKGSFTVQNVGNQAASKSQLQIRLSTDNRFDASDALLKTIAVGALKPGQKQKKTVSVTLPTGSSASGQFVLAVVDAANVVAETNENNNVIVFGPLP